MVALAVGILGETVSAQPSAPNLDLSQPATPSVMEPALAPPPARPRMQPSAQTPFSPLRTTNLPRYRPSRFRLASVPNMFGDLPGPASQILFNKSAIGVANGQADLPLAGSVLRTKIAENNKALPMDRIYFSYNRFQNALAAQNDTTLPLPGNGLPTGIVQRMPVDRYMIGIEKTFLDELWSVNVRMPFSNGPYFDDKSSGFGIFGGEVGNLNVSLKRLVFKSHDAAAAIGLGIDIPTGSDVDGVAQGETFSVHNDAVYLQPFVAILGTPSSRLFYNGFLQLDIGANGNRIDVGNVEVGVLQEQNLMLLDLSGGYWLVRNPHADWFTGLAGILEFHYATTLQDTDRVEVGDVFNPPPIGTLVNFLFSNRQNRMDIPNLTLGLHMEMARKTTLRVGGAFPLRDRPNRLFDAEVIVQLNRYF